MFENLLSWLLLPLGVLLGLALARKRVGEDRAGTTRAEVLTSSSKTINSEDDQAITALTRAVQADPATIELQMTLGGLFRKRGEIDRAIHLHEAVLARPALEPRQTALVRYELAQDYLRGGLMDRAESQLQDLVASGVHLAPALELLLDLYEQGRDWPNAIATAQRLQAARGSSAAPRIAHYHCEIAEAARFAGALDSADREAHKALETDHACARANLLLASLAEARDDWASAIRANTRVVEQDRRYLPEILAPLERCYAKAGNAAAYRQYLDDAEADNPDVVVVVLAKVALLRAKDEDTQTYLAEHLARTPSWRGLLVWLEGQKPDDPAASAVREALRRRLDARPRYVCTSCGLQPSVLFWQCPGCKQWATVAPVSDEL